MNPFSLPPQGVVTRWASAENPHALPGQGGTAEKGRKGKPNKTNLQPGEEFTLAHAEGVSGTLRRFWITIDDRTPAMLRGLVLRVYWDGADKPAIEAPLGDFFGCVLGEMATFESAYIGTAQGRSFVCLLPMPFLTGFRMTVTNESPSNLRMFFYDVNWTQGESHDTEVGYVHAHYRRENPTTELKDFEILPEVRGRGRYLGVHLGVIADQTKYARSWWGEGEVKVYLDGDTDLPTLCGTGTEDYVSTGWSTGQFDNLWHGCPLGDDERMRYGFYRWHGPDPVFFHESCRVTIQQIGHGTAVDLAKMLEIVGRNTLEVTANGGTVKTREELLQDKNSYLFERADDWCATAFFVLDSPVNELPPIEPFVERIAGL